MTLRSRLLLGLLGLVAIGLVVSDVTTYRALRAGFRVVEVPITFVDRTEGGSKMSRSIVLEAIWKVPLLRLSALRGRV